MKGRGRGVSMAAACLIAGLAVLLVAASASAAWTPRINIARGHDVAAPALAMHPAGDAVFMWRHDEGVDPTGIFTRTRDAGGTLSPTQALAPPDSIGVEHDLAVDSQGNTYFVWQEAVGSGVRARVRYADGTLSPVQTLKTAKSGGFIRDVQVGVDGSGTAVFAWWYRPDDGAGVIQARSRAPSGALSPVRTVAQSTGTTQTSMGVDSAGNATFLWEAQPASQSAEFTRVLAPDGGLSPVIQVSRDGYSSAGGLVAVTPAGRAVFAWNEYKAGKLTVLTRGRDGDGTLKPAQVLAAGDIDQPGGIDGHNLAIAPDGEAVVSWQSGDTLHARTRAPGGTLGPVRTVTTDVGSWDAGIDQQGNLVFAWQAMVDSKYRIFVRTVSADGTLSPAKAVSPSGYWASLGEVAVTPTGDAAVVWQEGKFGWAIQATFGP